MPHKNNVESDYLDWLYDYVCKGRAHQNISYKKLFDYLYQVEFTFSITNDINRAKDGVDLRYRYATEIDDRCIMDLIEGPCSVLEMIVALAIRCEESIMDDTRYGDRTGQWFWIMMRNLGLDGMTDDKFDFKYVEYCVSSFLNREYDPDGNGGLFYIKNCSEDLRNVEIWTQLCWFLYDF